MVIVTAFAEEPRCDSSDGGASDLNLRSKTQKFLFSSLFFFYCIWSLSVLMHMGLFSTISLGCEDGVTNLVVHPKVIPGLCRLGENPARKVKILEVDFRGSQIWDAKWLWRGDQQMSY